MSNGSPLITLLTDFGHLDPYVGVMKGVILARCPGARVVDLTHEIDAQEVGEANFALRGSHPYFPPGTIHVVVVDPGVGSTRRILCARSHGMLFLAPDNGVLTGVVGEQDEVRLVENRTLFRDEKVSNTFHGRDIFAPVAAHLAGGGAFEEVGPATGGLVELDLPRPVPQQDGGLLGAVIHVDRFGNLITNIREDDLESLEDGCRNVTFRGQQIGNPVDSYAAVPHGAPLAVVDSFGFLEIAVNSGNAAKHFNAERGDALRLGRPAS